MTADERSPKTAAFQGTFGVWPSRLLALATGLYAAVLTFATHYPKPDELIGRKLPSDKLLHFVAYGVFGLLAAALIRSRGTLDLRSATILGAGLAAWAVIDEITQPLFARAAEPLDWVCDCLGLAAGIGIVLVSSWALGRGSR